jgi:hypothetical protein
VNISEGLVQQPLIIYVSLHNKSCRWAPLCRCKTFPSFLIIFHSDKKEMDEGEAFITRKPWTATKQLQKL